MAMKPVHIAMAISVAVIWGMGFIVAKAALDHFSPILLMALRFTCAAICLCYFFRSPKTLYKDFFWISLLSAAIQYSLTFNGLKGIDASTAALLVQLEAPFGLLLAWMFLKDKILIKQIVGICVSFAGAILILGEPKLQGNLVYVIIR